MNPPLFITLNKSFSIIHARRNWKEKRREENSASESTFLALDHKPSCSLEAQNILWSGRADLVWWYKGSLKLIWTPRGDSSWDRKQLLQRTANSSKRSPEGLHSRAACYWIKSCCYWTCITEDEVYEKDSNSSFCIISKRFVNDRLIPSLDIVQSMPFRNRAWRFPHLAPVEVGLDAVVTDLHRDLSLRQIRPQERRLHTHSLLFLGLNHIPD